MPKQFTGATSARFCFSLPDYEDERPVDYLEIYAAMPLDEPEQ